MDSNNKPEVILRKLTHFIELEDELVNHKTINCSIIKTLRNAFYYSLKSASHQTGDVNNLFLQIESVLDYLQDELNTGHWSEVPIDIKRCFTSVSFIKCLVMLKSSESVDVGLLRKCLNSLDMGLLLGAPLKHNSSLLTSAARQISEEIVMISGEHTQTKSSERKFVEHKQYHEEIKAIEVDSVDCPSLEYFNKNYFSPQIPVKLKGCMGHWPATRKWLDVNYFLQVAGDRTVPIEVGSHYTDENWTQKLMTLKDFIKNHYLGNSSKVGYLAQHNLFDQITELKSDICIPEYCCLSDDYENAKEPDVNAWFGPQGTVSPLHYDPENNILAQVYGTKELILFSPKDSQFLYPHISKFLCNTAQVDPLCPNLEMYPEFTKTKMYKCLLEPGEMLFIPMEWWHHVSALDKSFSVSFWWR